MVEDAGYGGRVDAVMKGGPVSQIQLQVLSHRCSERHMVQNCSIPNACLNQVVAIILGRWPWYGCVHATVRYCRCQLQPPLNTAHVFFKIQMVFRMSTF